jgi:ATP-dependent RNA helicase DeaD
MIMEKDRERLLADPALTALVEDEEALELGRLLLERTTPEQVAASLIRLYRQKLPAPEEVYDDERMKRAQVSGVNDRGQADGPLRDFARDVDMVWFRINIGRDKNADPKWLLPTLCRLGHVTKGDIGSIKIFDRETKFEITRAAEARFRAAIASGLEDGVTVSDAVAPGPKERPASRWDKKPREDGGDRPERKPWANKTEGARPVRANKPAWKPREDGDKPAWKPREDKPAGEKKPWVKRDAAPAADGERPKWVKRTPDAPTPEGKKPWVKKPYAGTKPAWAPASDATPAAPGDKPWKGKPKGGDRPWAARDAHGKPAGEKKPFKGKKKPNG